MSTQSDKLYEYYKDSEQRAEYFLLGVIAASVAFFWKSGEPQRLGLNPATLHLAGLVFLFAALIVALRRLHKLPRMFAIMSQEHLLLDEREQLVKSASENRTVVGSSGILNPKEQVRRIEELNKSASEIHRRFDELNGTCVRLYRDRNILLVLGYLCFLAERVWAPYFG